MGVKELIEIRKLINQARRDTLAMFVAMQREDQDRVVLAATRARVALAAADRTVQAWDSQIAITMSSVIALLRSTRALAQSGFSHVPTEKSVSEAYWLLARVMSAPIVDASRTELVELDLDDLDLAGASFGSARLTRCRMVASTLTQACFADAALDTCDLARANLERTTWLATRAVSSRFAGAMMTDTVLDRASFLDCDLRGADLSVVKCGPFASAARVELIDCDLRETSWRGRVLRGLRMEGCKVYGMRGAPVLEGVEIERCDLSSKGDGSQIASGQEVSSKWG